MEMESNFKIDTAYLAQEIAKTIAELNDVGNDYHESTPNDFRVLARGMKLTLVALASSIGECQRDTPYTPMHPVNRPNGTFQWCCNHDPEHCTNA